MNRHEISSEWLEPVLAEHLRRVPAPDELWHRVQMPRVERAPGSRLRFAWALASTLAIAAVAWGLHARVNALASRGANLAFRCADPTEIRAWVKANTGLDIPLPAKPASTIQLMSARVVAGDSPSAEVDYLVAGHEARLVVSKARSETRPHRDLASSGSHASWTMHGQTYVLACADPAELRTACLLCHAGGQSL